MPKFVYFVAKIDSTTMTKWAIDPRHIMGYVKSTKEGECEGAFEDSEPASRKKERYNRKDLKAGTCLMLVHGGTVSVMESFEEVKEILEEAMSDF